jgi:hypothetical protein
VEGGIDACIVAPGLDDRSGILGALLMAVESSRQAPKAAALP